MRKVIGMIFVALVLIQCSENKEKKESKPSMESLKTRIDEMNDSLQGLYADLMEDPSKKIPSIVFYEAINRHLDFYKNYPKDPYSATCLDKVQQLYLQEKVYEKSLEYTDTLLLKYPKYEKKASVLLNAGSTADVMQDTAKVRRYYSQLLDEYPNLNKETKEMVEFRLKHLNLTFDQLIELQMKNLTKK